MAEVKYEEVQSEYENELADRLETFADKLTIGTHISRGEMTNDEFIKLLSALRYAVVKLRH